MMVSRSGLSVTAPMGAQIRVSSERIRLSNSVVFWSPDADVFLQVDGSELSGLIVELDEGFRLLSFAIDGGQSHPKRHSLPQKFGIADIRH
ncbi:hypothetical protein [Sulfuritalea sp.]|uniref:hypothetical protein n=1 Tax=Sulfuritalea sp. TaxID=2480090 RepID=UPI00286D8109|nr:hypothetical protein [Sulfuritalea sp.]